jgi:flagellar hook-length control protein FliK
MIKPSAAFNLTQIIESLDSSASSVKENPLKSTVEGDHFSVTLAAAMAQVGEVKVGTEVAALSEVGKSLPLSSSPPWHIQEHSSGNAEINARPKFANMGEKRINSLHILDEISENQEPVTGSESVAELKLQTVSFMNGRKVLTSLVHLDDIDSNYSPIKEYKSEPYDSKLNSLPLLWEDQKIQQKYDDNKMSLAGRMVIAHNRQVNINEVTKKELIDTNHQLEVKNTINKEDLLDLSIPVLADVMQKFQSFIQDPSNKSSFNVNEDSQELMTSPAQTTADASSPKDMFELTEQQMNNLREYLRNNIEITSDARFLQNFEDFTNSNLGVQAIKKYLAHINVADMDTTASLNSNRTEQASFKPMNETVAHSVQMESKVQPAHVGVVSTTVDINEERFTGFIPPSNSTTSNSPISLKGYSSNDVFNYAKQTDEQTANIAGVNNTQDFAIEAELGMTQRYEVREIYTQAQSTQNLSSIQRFATAQFGEQLMSLVAREIKIPQQDGVDVLRIEITPPELGDLEIELKKQGKDLEVRILASTEAVADTIKENSSVLKNILVNQEFSRVQVNVDTSKREHANQQGQEDTREGKKEKQTEQRYVKIRIRDGVIDTFV